MKTNLAQALVFATFLIYSVGLNAQSINRAQIVSQTGFELPPLPNLEEPLIGSRKLDLTFHGISESPSK